MNDFAPGPWTRQVMKCGCCIEQHLGNHYSIRYCHRHAAADEMYEAIQDFLDSKRIMHEGHTVYYVHENATVIENMKAALAKAEGESDD